MASSSGSWLLILIILIIGAVVILSANEANYGFFSTDGIIQSGSDIKKEGGKLVDEFLGNFGAKPEKTNTAPKSNAVKKPVVISDNQKDALGRRDRAELNDLLDQVTK